MAVCYLRSWQCNRNSHIWPFMQSGKRYSYPHAYVQKSRLAVFSISRAVRRDRSHGGETLIMHRDNGRPNTVYSLTHFGPERMLKQLDTNRDRHFVQNLYCNTGKDYLYHNRESFVSLGILLKLIWYFLLYLS